MPLGLIGGDLKRRRARRIDKRRLVLCMHDEEEQEIYLEDY